MTELVFFKWQIKNKLRKYSGQWKRFFGYVDEVTRELTSVYGFTILDVNLEGSGSGIICFSPEGKEIYREIPKTNGWRYNFLKSILWASQK